MELTCPFCKAHAEMIETWRDQQGFCNCCGRPFPLPVAKDCYPPGHPLAGCLRMPATTEKKIA